MGIGCCSGLYVRDDTRHDTLIITKDEDAYRRAQLKQHVGHQDTMVEAYPETQTHW